MQEKKQEIQSHNGAIMSKREAFVMAAMQGLCSLEDVHEETSDEVARKAIIIADATLAALGKEGE